MNQSIKEFYGTFHDEIVAKRFDSPYPIRRHVHREMYDRVLEYVKPGMLILDAGCGEGTLSFMMAQKGATVVGVDYSAPNIEAARQFQLVKSDCAGQVTFLRGDAEHLPFSRDAFDLVVSNHVLEHLPNFQQGLDEIHRVCRQKAVIAVPTCLSPYAWPLLGGATYWKFGKRSLFAIVVGLARVLFAFVRGKEGVNEGYTARRHLIHIFRFPWRVKDRLRRAGFLISEYGPQALGIPYLKVYFESTFARRIMRDFGLGTVFYIQKSR